MVIEASFAVQGLTLIAINVEANLIGGNLNAGLLVNPSDNLAECAHEKIGVELGIVRQREIEVFGKTVGLEVAFFEAGAALKDPAFRKLRLRVNSRQQPA